MLWGLRSTILHPFVQEPRRFFLWGLPALVPIGPLTVSRDPGIDGTAPRDRVHICFLVKDSKEPIYPEQGDCAVVPGFDGRG